MSKKNHTAATDINISESSHSVIDNKQEYDHSSGSAYKPPEQVEISFLTFKLKSISPTSKTIIILSMIIILILALVLILPGAAILKWFSVTPVPQSFHFLTFAAT